jgi:hypothetical protein
VPDGGSLTWPRPAVSGSRATSFIPAFPKAPSTSAALPRTCRAASSLTRSRPAWGFYGLEESLRLYHEHLETCPAYHTPRTPCALYRRNPATMEEPSLAQLAPAELAGQDLACRCPLNQACHADLLLRLAARSQDG